MQWKNATASEVCQAQGLPLAWQSHEPELAKLAPRFTSTHLLETTAMKSKIIEVRAQRGSAGNLILGFVMMCAGFYLLLQSIVVTQSYFLGVGLFHLGGASITSGMILVPLIFGIGMIFYNTSSLLGWALAIGSLAALVIGVIVNTHFALRSMSLFEMLGIFVLAVGGLGLFLRGVYGNKRTLG
ncbi:MAG: hypothetical protein P4L91_19225 [Burkholderiaceae bacterium]|nr:hypothetical protein [Burkholderiaceae bacterium]